MKYELEKEMKEIFKALENVKGMKSKSNVISPVLWIYFSTLVSFISYSSFSKNPNQLIIVWLLIFLSGLILTVIIMFVVLIFKYPDLLRSEMYLIRKSLIDKGILGDENTLNQDMASQHSDSEGDND
ncbi:hypothetical protein F542_11740 [Bibersteinia trehalosi USDA-ARS-USMARC-188]|uniref:Uncharacterized protein n=3 Tax=Bibersteinia trehalosi TaxID=47735 RepID=A0A4V7IA98_BIBTR|nr:hypothetical protein F542_11740 [Bibersteinia trehalosi USDA-ARS-USMARC-188]AHG84187.1 hypothetical protein F543_13230 [Bibersteinia trehalosi USDA-ARS-USMARC-189]